VQSAAAMSTEAMWTCVFIGLTLCVCTPAAIQLAKGTRKKVGDVVALRDRRTALIASWVTVVVGLCEIISCLVRWLGVANLPWAERAEVIGAFIGLTGAVIATVKVPRPWIEVTLPLASTIVLFVVALVMAVGLTYVSQLLQPHVAGLHYESGHEPDVSYPCYFSEGGVPGGACHQNYKWQLPNSEAVIDTTFRIESSIGIRNARFTVIHGSDIFSPCDAKTDWTVWVDGKQIDQEESMPAPSESAFLVETKGSKQLRIRIERVDNLPCDNWLTIVLVHQYP
jgi:hypothetical protein